MEKVSLLSAERITHQEIQPPKEQAPSPTSPQLAPRGDHSFSYPRSLHESDRLPTSPRLNLPRQTMAKDYERLWKDLSSNIITSKSVPSPESTSVKSASSAMTFTRPLTQREQELLAHLDRLKFFLATAPSKWSADEPDESDPSSIPVGHSSSTHPAFNRFLLPNREYVSCVLWGGFYHITGTDIVRTLVFRFEAFGRPVRNMKKFEEGVFCDLRNLKPDTDACLEESKVRSLQPVC